MQRLLLLLLLTTLVMMLGCESKQQSTSAENGKPPSFSTAEEAAADAKSDLLAIMRTRKNFNLGLDENAIEKSQPAKPVKRFQITFDQLLSAEANTTFATLERNELATVVPLIANNNVVTIVGVGKEAEGWRVASLIDKSISDELNVLWHAMPDSSRGEITIYDLPHTSVKVYAVNEAGAEGRSRLFTNYRGLNIQQAVPAEQLLAVLKRDAAEYQRRLANRPGGEMIFH